jgi:hypothetical protein
VVGAGTTGYFACVKLIDLFGTVSVSACENNHDIEMTLNEGCESGSPGSRRRGRSELPWFCPSTIHWHSTATDRISVR